MKVDRIKTFLENMKLFLKGTFDLEHQATFHLKKKAMDESDNFLLLLFPDLLGLPTPTSYYTLELFPYIAQELDSWENRILRRKEILGDRWGDFCC